MKPLFFLIFILTIFASVSSNDIREISVSIKSQEILYKNIRVIGWNNITSIPLSNDFCNSESDDSNALRKANIKILNGTHLSFIIQFIWNKDDESCLLILSFDSIITYNEYQTLNQLIDEQENNDYVVEKEGNITLKGTFHIKTKEKNEKEIQTSIGMITLNKTNENKVNMTLLSVDFALDSSISFIVLKNKNKTAKNIFSLSFSIILLLNSMLQFILSHFIKKNYFKSQSISSFLLIHNIFFTIYNINAITNIIKSNIDDFIIFFVILFFALLNLFSDSVLWISFLKANKIKRTTIIMVTSMVYILSFIISTVGYTFYSDYLIVYTHIALIWIPQIIYTGFESAIYSIPIGYVVMLTIYKLFPVLFFCFVDIDFKRKDKYDLFFTIIIAESVILAVLLFQLFKEDKINRICKYLNIENEEESNNMYKSETEIMKKYPQSENEQCAICLQDLYQKKKINTTLSTDFVMQRGFTIKEYFYCIFCNLISFTKKTNKKGADYYIITKCVHIFHAQCLEDWLAVKKECPTCRRPIAI